MRPIIAIDPGKSGGIVYGMGNGSIEVYSMPATEGDVVDLLRSLVARNSDTIAVIEKVGGFIKSAKKGSKETDGGQPGSAMFTFGFGVGLLHGVLMALSVPVHLVTPQRWQAALMIGNSRGLSKSEWKNKLKSEAQRRYPHVDRITLSTADALHILGYARKELV